MSRELGLPFDPIDRAARIWERRFGPSRGRDAVAVATRDLMAADFGLAGYSEQDRAALFTLLRGLRLSAGDFTES